MTDNFFSRLTPLVEVTRGGIVESQHCGAIAVVDSHGKILFRAGDPQLVTFLRSSAKPFQVLPFIETGGADFFHLSLQEMAVMCASHSGTDDHVRVIRGIQDRIGVSEANLMCGTHTPFDDKTAKELILKHEKPTPIRHNCSGKHTGMLAHCQMDHAPLDNYLDLEHPVQKEILSAFARMCDLPEEKVVIGIDGCSAPNFATPLYNAALAFALFADPSSLPAPRANALRVIRKAMTEYPDMVSGPGRLDLKIMQTTRGKVLCKAGAEGYYAMNILPGELHPGAAGVGIVIKIADGDNADRARACVAVEVLRQLGVIGKEEIHKFSEDLPREIRNQRSILVGEIRPAFSLQSN